MSALLRGVTWEHERGFGSIVAASGEYMRTHPDVRIEWVARSLQSFADQPIEALADSVDLLVIDHPHVPSAARNRQLAPLDEFLPPTMHADQFIGPSHDSYRYEGSQYGLATDAAAQVAVYRADLLEVVPETWEQVLELAEGGRVLWPAKPIDAFSSLVTMLGAHGAEIMRSNTVFADRDALADAWRVLSRLAAAVPERCLGLNPIQVAEELSSGSQYVYSPLGFGYTNYSRAGYREARLTYTDAPVLTSGDESRGSLLGGAGIAVSAGSGQREIAAAFAVWLASSETQRGSYFAGGGQPGHVDAWNDPVLDEVTDGFFSGTRRTLANAYVRPQHPSYLTLQDLGSPQVTRALAGDLSFTELADDLDDLVRTHLRSTHAGR